MKPPTIVTAVRKLLDSQYPPDPEIESAPPVASLAQAEIEHGSHRPLRRTYPMPEHPGQTIAELQDILVETQAALNKAINERQEARAESLMYQRRTHNLEEQLAVRESALKQELQAASYSCTQRTIELENLRTQYVDKADEFDRLQERFLENLDTIADLKRRLDTIRTALNDPSGRND